MILIHDGILLKKTDWRERGFIYCHCIKMAWFYNSPRMQIRHGMHYTALEAKCLLLLDKKESSARKLLWKETCFVEHQESLFKFSPVGTSYILWEKIANSLSLMAPEASQDATEATPLIERTLLVPTKEKFFKVEIRNMNYYERARTETKSFFIKNS